MLFFSEMANEGALDIELLDTLFFQPDHSIYYVYRVQVRPLRTPGRDW